ncbi:reverse transcriptase, partial [Lasius niger]
AVITPIPKINHPTLVQHYRPISILPYLSKVLERVVLDQLTEYLREKDLLDPCQFAYRRLHADMHHKNAG